MTEREAVVAETEARIVAWLQRQHDYHLARAYQAPTSSRWEDLHLAATYNCAKAAIEAGAHHEGEGK